MKLLDRLERRFGRYAIPNLPKYIIILYVIGAALELFVPGAYAAFLALNPYQILHGQVWRLVTFLLCPPTNSILFLIFVMLFYYYVSQALEQSWGSFRFDLYILTGVIGTIIAAFLLYAFSGSPLIYMDTGYLNLSIFLAYAAMYPNQVVLLYGLIPIRVKWLGILDGVMLLVSFIQGGWSARVSIVVAMLNFLVYFLLTRNTAPYTPKQLHRKREFRQSVRRAEPSANPNVARHKCAVCGRTEKDDPDLEFRFCSKCDGNYEYCQDHLFTHQHIHPQAGGRENL